MPIAEFGLPGFADYDLSRLRAGIMAGSPGPVEVMRTVLERMHMPGVSICSGTPRPRRFPRRLARRFAGAAGRQLEIEAVDPVTRQTVPRGVAGVFCTRG